jgi:hypothetical protein
MSKVREKLLSVVLGLTLVGAIAVIVAHAISAGLRFVDIFPRISRRDSALGNGFLFFMISGTDWPARLRRSPFVRVQLECWSLWLFLLGFYFALESEPAAEFANLGFLIAACLLAGYSLVSLFCPRDVLRGWEPSTER